MNRLIKTFSIWILLLSATFAQFGQNKVQYKQFDWYYVQTKHFDIYFTSEGTQIAEYSVQIAENVLTELQDLFNYKINNRLSIIAYNSHNDFQETNTTDAQYGQGTGGFTEPFKNRVVVPFEGSYKKYEHLLRHELVHQVMNDMLYGGTIQNIIAKNITLQLPLWYLEGMAEYLAAGWETYTDMFIRDQIISETLPDINQLSGYLAYRAGQSIIHFIATTYGNEKIGEILNNTKGMGSLDAAIKTSLGLNIEELNERWKKALKKEYWPEVATRETPDDFSKKLTDNRKIGGFYNTSPAISPQGDKIAFISDRDIFLDVYVMNAVDGEVIKKVLESGKTNDFEELNVLFPSLSWSPDNKSLTMSAKSGGWDVIYIVDVETENSYSLPIHFDGIESVAWSPDGEKIAFIGANTIQSDAYIYNLKTNELLNVTSDIFSETDPSWSPDSKKVFFSSDRGKFLTPKKVTDDFDMSDDEYSQLDIYYADLDNKEVVRVTNWEQSDENSVVVSPDGSEILFISDKNGIRNIYKKRIVLSEADSVNLIEDIPAFSITNSIGEINQLSSSADGKKLVFTSLYNSGYNVYLMNNPFEKEEYKSVEPTNYIVETLKKVYEKPAEIAIKITKESPPLVESPIEIPIDTTKTALSTDEFIKVQTDSVTIFSGQYIASTDTTEKSAEVDYSRYIFGVEEFNIDTASTRITREELFKESLDENGNFLVNKYKVSFSPDLIYANAGYSDLYGLLGTTILLFSDMIGNHRLIGITSLQIDLKNSDYGLAYYNLGNRLNYGLEGFHTARFVYVSNANALRLYRFRSYGGIASLSYPINRFYRIDGSLSVQSVSSENLDDISVPNSTATYFIPALSFVHDNTIWGYTSPIEGSRFNFTLFGNPGFTNAHQSFYSFTWDYRDYSRFWFDNSFVFRISGGYSGGANPQRFFMGGTEGWINRTFATGEVPLQNPSDFAFLTPALPLRGYDYAERIGSKYALINLELRMPVIRYLVTGPLPLFIQNILGVAFVDLGSAWNDTSKLKLFTKNDADETVTNDLLIGTGLGWRINFILLWRFDVAWTFNFNSFSKPRYYISFGLDF